MDVTIMVEASSTGSLLRLMAWLSPAFPVGSFSYSHGLERAAHEVMVSNATELRDWIEQLLRHGSGWNDAVLFAEAWRRAGGGGDVTELEHLAEALAGSRERHMEAMLQGAAFVKAAASWSAEGDTRLPQECAYCVAVGAQAGAHAVPLPDALAAYLQAFASNLIQAGIRLSILGQRDAVATLAALETTIADVAKAAKDSTVDDLGSCTVFSDTMAMRHETQYSRLFRS
jgi:urease accessory protein